jgi:peptidoglycan/xylan/chitin deacetylase (PgdA/CDA1 family)
MAHPMAGKSVRLALLRIGLAMALAGCTAPSPSPPTTPSPPVLPPPIAIAIDGVAHQVAPGTTLGTVARAFDLKPVPGRLLSVSGAVLEPKGQPGQLLLNGAVADRFTELATGDAIVVLDGLDRVEGTRRVTDVLGGRRPTNPQYSLRTWPMKEIDVVGRASGEITSTVFRPVGKSKVPGRVALSFDDGPWPKYTRDVLNVLRHHHVHATFFMIGRNVERWPGIARDVVDAGMVVGNHSWDHVEDPPFAKIGAHRLQTELADTDDALRKLGVKHPCLFRPPGGSVDDAVVQEARLQGLRVVNWNVDPQDWRSSRSARQIAHAVLSHVGPGSIVDLHDGGGNQRATVRALPMIIKGIRKMGLRLVAIHR